MEDYPALLALCVGNSPVTIEFPSQRTSNEDWCFYDADPHKLLKKQSNDMWFGTTWLLCDVIVMKVIEILPRERPDYDA